MDQKTLNLIEDAFKSLQAEELEASAEYDLERPKEAQTKLLQMLTPLIELVLRYNDHIFRIFIKHHQWKSIFFWQNEPEGFTSLLILKDDQPFRVAKIPRDCKGEVKIVTMKANELLLVAKALTRIPDAMKEWHKTNLIIRSNASEMRKQRANLELECQSAENDLVNFCETLIRVSEELLSSR
ncbi:MAG TPA: hypothetical protein VLE93_01920 [Candidatus Saccharimonadales bacterium]|nr:hypothetical protein [Candidatus Saccharimonadales bacterium]